MHGSKRLNIVLAEPINLREWKKRDSSRLERGRLFTCGRPGRATFERKKVSVPEHIIDLWVEGLPKATTLHIVSLLGKKKTGFSEFGYYHISVGTRAGLKTDLGGLA